LRLLPQANAAVISDPRHLDITSAEAAGPPYRFGLHITDFHICKQCGVFVAATAPRGGAARVVNIHALHDRRRLIQPVASALMTKRGGSSRQATAQLDSCKRDSREM